MNHVYRLIWSTSLGCWMVASEHTRSHGKRSSTARGLVAAVVLALSVPAAAADVLLAPTEDAVETLEQADERTINSAALAVHKERIALFGDALRGGNAASAVPLAVNRALQAEVNDPSFAWATLKGENSLVLGSRASVTGNRSTGIGNEVLITGGGHTVVGSQASASGQDAVAMGINAMADGTGNIAIGEAARADTVSGGIAGVHAVAIGARAQAGSPGWTGAVALGGDALALYNGIALGYKAYAHKEGATALGFEAIADNFYSSAIGYRAVATGGTSMAIGSSARSAGNYSLALGSSAQTGTNAHSSIAVGNAAEATSANAIALGRSAQVTGLSAIALGQSSKAGHDSAIALGTQAEATGSQSLAIGLRTKAGGQTAMAVGMDAQATGNYSTALGHQAKAGSAWTNAIGYQSEAMGSSSVALGTLAKSAASGSVAVGDRAQVNTSASSSMALGHSAAVNAGASNAVALGNGSVATAASTVSVGSATLKRKIVNVGDGEVSASSTDAVTGKQLHAVSNRLNGQSVALGDNTRISGGRAVSIGANSQVDTGGGNDGIAIGGNARAGTPGYGGPVAIGGGATADYDGLALGYAAQATAGRAVALGRGSIANVANTVSVGSDTLKRKIVNVADGAVSATSSETVTGKQLFATNQNVTTATNTANAAKLEATAALTKANLVSGLVGQASATGSVRLGAENTGTALDVRNKANANRTVSGVADGALSSGSTEAVTGKQLFATNQNVTTATNTANAAKLEATAALTKANLVSGLVGQASATGSVRLGAENTGTALDVRNKANANRTVSGVADGALSTGSTEAVTGKQLFATNQNVTTATNTANTAKTAADVAQGNALDALGKANHLNGLVSQAAANGAVRIGAENTGTALDVRNKANANRTVSGVADGALSAGSTEAVTGKQLFATNQNVTTATNTANTAKTAADVAQGNALDALGKANHLNGLVSQAAVNGAVRLGAENTGTALDVRNKANANRTLSGVADGALSTGSTEAVTGKQLFATNQNVTTATNTANTAKTAAYLAQGNALDALGKANHLNGLVSQAAVNGAVRLGAANTGSVVDVRNSNGGTRTLSGVTAGAMHAGSSEAVNGAQLSAINERVELHSVAIAVNRLEIGVNRDGLEELRKAFDGFEPDLTGVVKYNADGSLVDLDGAKVAGVTAGEVSASSRDAINGSQLFGTNERVGYLEEQQRYVMVGALDASLPAKAGILGVAVGGDAEARQEGATAVGSYASALGRNSVALGRGSYVAPDARNGFALGTRTNVESEGGMAIGADSDVMLGADQSVALGSASVAKEADTVSVGSGDYRRRIVSVARGTKDDNVTTLVQLREAVTALGGGAAIDAAGQVVAPKYTLSGGEFNNVGAALTSIDTKLVGHRDELDTLDSQYKALVQNDRSIRFTDDRSVVDFGGARLTGVAAGSLKADSSDAVNGAQLFATNERVGYVEQQQRYVMVGTDELSGAAQAGIFGVAVGGDARAREEGATAVGSFASALGRNSVALGRGSYVAPEARNGFALGTRTNVEAVGGMAIGSDSVVWAGAEKSVALGTASVAKEANTVAVGNDGLKRRIVHVAQGIKSDDATTVSQLRGTLAALGGGADLDANGNVIGPRYAVQGSEYGSFGDAINALDGSVGDNKRNLDTLDSRFQRLFQESPSVNADAPGRLSLGGAQGMVLGNVANGLIGQGSRDAVNGGQLWAVKQDLQGQIDALDPGKSDASATPLALNARSGSITPSADGGGNLTPPDATPPAADPGKVAAQDPLVKAEGDNAVAVGSEGKERAVKHVAEGRADTDAANVRQVNDALERANAYTDSAVASVNQRLDQVDKRINRMAAISSAQSAMAMNTAGLATANRLGAGVGYSEGESAMAVGYQRVLTERGSATFSLNGAFTNSGEKSVGVGVGIGW